MSDNGRRAPDGGSEDEDGEEPWELVMADMEATAEAYRERGWEAVELLPDLVGVLEPEVAPKGQGGFDLVVDEAEFAELRETVADAEFESFELFRAEDGEVVYVVAAMEARDELVVLLAATYRENARETLASLVEEGTVYVHVRADRTDPDDRVTFTLDGPTGLVPGEE
jgi:hypothetical protein